MPSLSKSKRAFLIVGPPTFLLVGAWCLRFALTFDRCGRGCISEGAGMAVAVSSGLVALLLFSAALFTLRAWITESRRDRIVQLGIRVAVLAVGLFVAWVFLASWASISVST